VNIKS